MAIWLVPSAEQTELDQLVTDGAVQTGELVYNETSNSLQLGFNDGGQIRFDDVASQAADGSIDLSKLNTGTATGALLTVDADGNASTVDVAEGQILVRNSDGNFESRLVTNDIIEDSSIALSKLATLAPNQMLVTDSSGDLTTLTVEEGQIVGRTTNGAIVGQKLQPSMVDDGGIPFAKLPQIGPGQVLGVPVNNNVNAPNADVQALDISSVAGRPLTASVAAPNNPQDNDLWYYCGEEVGDAARLYIFRDDSWVDASPPIVNTNPGADGMDVAQGPAGDSVDFVQIADRTSTDPIVGQKLQPSMVDDGGIPFAKLPEIGPGQVLGVPVNNNVNAPNAVVEALDISSVAGRPLTASVAAPNNPQDNDLWYYCGEEEGDAARLYIFRDEQHHLLPHPE